MSTFAFAPHLGRDHLNEWNIRRTQCSTADFLQQICIAFLRCWASTNYLREPKEGRPMSIKCAVTVLVVGSRRGRDRPDLHRPVDPPCTIIAREQTKRLQDYTRLGGEIREAYYC
ncbi:hypothetical protein HD597_005368 [Nonomuraea thailandensis]|uniref:Uncharacterized protein n=1 Tax=Nonomuraea thailandensis TaxID=1188745 RepID=A0A9X2GPY4_9ACTN|nr:hypothetical protein [Nonomuraea thailandensis]MCP2358348.1 hypothetical protein [Nonomuraea thailandensis]